jgi:hypothetical protein
MKLSYFLKISMFVFPAVVISCLQANYEEPILDYIQPPAGDIVSGLFSVEQGSNMLIVTLNGGTFQERISADQFILYRDNTRISLNVPLRDSENGALFSFGEGEELSGGSNNYRLVVTKAALKTAVSRVTVQAVKGGTWTAASDVEGAFGRSQIWDIAYGNGRFVAVGDDGKMAYSSDGRTWTAIQPGYGARQSKFTNAIRGIAWGGNEFIAVGYDTRMAYSDNGLNWNGWDESLVGGNSILCITYGGNRFVAGGDNGKIIYMHDGGNWTGVGESRFGEKSILALAWGDNVYVAAGQDGQIAWSNDAANWDYVDGNFGGAFIRGLAWGNNYFVAAGDSGKIARSPNGREWESISSPFGANSGIQSVAFGGGIFIAVGHDGKMARSADGLVWTAIEPGNGDSQNKFAGNWELRAVGYGGGKFAAAGNPYPPDTSCRIVYSYQPPVPQKAPENTVSEPFTSQAGDNRLIITLTGGKFAESVSVNQFSMAGTPLSGSLVERGDTKVVIRLNVASLGGSGQTVTVAAGALALRPTSISVSAEKALTWTAVITPPNHFGDSNITAFAYNGSNQYVAVGAGKIATSTNGTSWTEITSTEKDQWANANDYVRFTDVAYGDGKFVAVGYWINGGENFGDNNFAGWGASAVSTNGTTWTITDCTISTSSTEGVSPRVYAVTYSNSRFIAVGQWGRSAWSTDGSSWNFVQIEGFNYLDNQNYFEDVQSIAYGGGILVAAGGNGKTSYSQDNGTTWKWAANMLLGDGVTVNTVRFGNGIFIAAGNDGNMKFVSQDQIAPADDSENGGDNWQGVNSKFDRSGILSVAHNGLSANASRFIAAGHDGKMSESPDGENWAQIVPGTGADQNKFGDREQISCVFWTSGRFIAGGNAYSGNASKITYSD